MLVTVRGGNYSAGTPREGWDHATAWMRRILEDVWQLDLSVVEREFTLVGVNPALDEFKDLADQLAERPASRRATTAASSPAAVATALSAGRLKPAPVPAEPHQVPAS